MKSTFALTQEDTEAIIAAANQHAAKHNWAVCIAVVDAGGHLLGFQRRDGCATASVAIAQAKAVSAAMRRRATKLDEDLIANGRIAALSMPGVTFLEGGLPIIHQGDVIGAVGVSGVKSSEDAEIAAAGIAALIST
jgi:glc operon protein GlcG